jgi:hypothetical protein
MRCGAVAALQEHGAYDGWAAWLEAGRMPDSVRHAIVAAHQHPLRSLAREHVLAILAEWDPPQPRTIVPYPLFAEPQGSCLEPGLPCAVSPTPQA